MWLTHLFERIWTEKREPDKYITKTTTNKQISCVKHLLRDEEFMAADWGQVMWMHEWMNAE